MRCARPGERVLAAARVTKSALDAAKIKWARDLKGNDMLQRLYGELFYRERAGLRGEPERVQAKTVAVQAAPAAVAEAPPSMEETAMAPLILNSGPALPFVEGKFEPVAQAAEPRQERPFDAYATRLPTSGDGDTLPFVRLLPSQTLQKKP